MTDRAVRELLTQVADAVPPRDFAQRAWEQAHRRRRRRRQRAATLVLVAAAIIGVVLVVPDVRNNAPDRDEPVATEARDWKALATTTEPHILAGPTVAEESTLPWAATALPRHVIADAGGAARLTEDPPDYALALFQAPVGEQYTPGPVLVLGDDGELRRIDGLSPVPDSGGNLSFPVDAGSLSPNGRRAAFAQRDVIVVIELTSGVRRELPAPGYNEEVRWSPDSQRLLVAQEGSAVLLDIASGKRSDVPAESPWGLAFADDAQLVDLGSSDPRTLVRLDAWTGEILSTSTIESDVSEWWSGTWARGDRVARGGFTQLTVQVGDFAEPQAVTVVKTSTGETERTLAFDWQDRSKGCCAALGWLDARTLLISADGPETHRVLAWDVRDGTIARVTEIDRGVQLSLGPVAGK